MLKNQAFAVTLSGPFLEGYRAMMVCYPFCNVDYFLFARDSGEIVPGFRSVFQ
jgi:hypothetical protein